MKKWVTLLCAFMFLISIIPVTAQESPSLEQVRKFAENNIQWMGNAAVKITGETVTLYFDPLGTVKSNQAGIILITHSHADHLYPDALKSLTGPDTVVVAPEAYVPNATILKPGDHAVIKGIAIEAVPAYNINGVWHPRAKQWVGYIVTIDGIRIYVSGDTDVIPEMKGIKADIAILSIPGNGYAMGEEEGVQAALELKPIIAIPVHYMGVVMDPEAGKFFKEDLKGQVEVVVKAAKAF